LAGLASSMNDVHQTSISSQYGIIKKEREKDKEKQKNRTGNKTDT